MNFKNYLSSIYVTKYKLKIIDTIDHFILALDKYDVIRRDLPEEKYNIIEKVTDLYKIIDIPIELLTTPFNITEEEFSEIVTVCGKNIPIKDIDNYKKNIHERILMDFAKIIEVSRLKPFWNDINKNEIINNEIHIKKDIIRSKSTHMEENNITKGELRSRAFGASGNPIPFSGSEFYLDLNNESSYFTSVSNNYKLIDEIDSNVKELYTYALYNELYNTSLIIQESNDELINILVKEFSEFKIITKLINLSEENYNLIYKLFNGKIFDDFDNCKNKIEAFINLYDINKITTNNDLGKNYSEKEEVLLIINNTYEINNNIADKIKANDLYTLIEYYTPLNKKNLSFRKRVSGYLIELGLSRKRESAGIYYYGLRKKKYDLKPIYDESITKEYDIKMKDLLIQRDNEIKNNLK